jgi:hypothetical protein
MEETIPEFRRVRPATRLNTGPERSSSQRRHPLSDPSGEFDGSPATQAHRQVPRHSRAVLRPFQYQVRAHASLKPRSRKQESDQGFRGSAAQRRAGPVRSGRSR